MANNFPKNKWYPLGLKLGLHKTRLDDIEAKYKDDVDRCLLECLSAWLNKVDNVINLAALCVGEVTVVCWCVCVFVCLCVCVCVQKCFSFLRFFLKHGNCYSYQILYATSNSCKLSFHVVTKKLIDSKPLKSWQEKIQR